VSTPESIQVIPVDETLAKIPNWWDTEVQSPAQPVTDDNYLLQASDRLALAALVQAKSGGDQGITDLLGQWCLDLKRADNFTVVAVLRGLDHLDREACEPQTWQHLKAAETAVARYVAQKQGRASQ
jgi:hypothetical protein